MHPKKWLDTQIWYHCVRMTHIMVIYIQAKSCKLWFQHLLCEIVYVIARYLKPTTDILIERYNKTMKILCLIQFPEEEEEESYLNPLTMQRGRRISQAHKLRIFWICTCTLMPFLLSSTLDTVVTTTQLWFWPHLLTHIFCIFLKWRCKTNQQTILFVHISLKLCSFSSN